MKRLRIILGLSLVILAAAAIWAWQSDPQPAEPTVAGAPHQPLPSPPVRQSSLPTPSQAVESDATPAPATKPQATAPDVNQVAASAPAEPPNVDTPEPAQQKFARGGRAEPDQH